MTESEAIEKLKNMRLFMQITDKNSEHKFAEDDYKANEMAINALEKQIPKKPEEMDCIGFDTLVCPKCKMALYLYEPYCDNCGQAIYWSDENEID